MLQDDNLPVDDAPADEGDGAPRQSYNFAPGYNGIVYRADVPDHGAGPARDRTHSAKAKPTGTTHTTNANTAATTDTANINASTDTDTGTGKYKLQTMKWGLIPSWTKRNPDYPSVLKTINCRDDSLALPGGLWASMKGRKRCVVLAQGFYEWLSVGRDKVPYFVRRRDGRLMCFAGLWDFVRYPDGEGEGVYSYTVVTTGCNEAVRFLHERMPVIFDPGSEAMRAWLDPRKTKWDGDLQRLLRPYEGATELEVYQVAKEVGKVGNNSPAFVVPVKSRENRQNIANWFVKGEEAKGKKVDGEGVGGVKREADTEGDEGPPVKKQAKDEGPVKGEDSPVKKESPVKNEELPTKEGEESPAKKGEESPIKATLAKASASPVKALTEPSKDRSRPKISATTNAKSPVKGKAKGKMDGGGSQKITNFFGKA